MHVYHKLRSAILLLLLFPVAVNAQIPNITQLEYFIDTDPGRGNATAVAIVSATDISGLTVPVPVGALATGFHTMVVRSLDANGNWSLDNPLLFFKPGAAPGAVPNITALEYYIDSDPGRGNAIAVTISPAQDISGLTVPVPINALAPGFHLMGVRSRDANGNWSLDNYWLFFKGGAIAPTIPAITSMEYYIDTDPGRGSATPITITPGTDIPNLSLPVPINAYLPGIHIMGVRSRDANGNWSLDNRWLFAKAFPNAGVIPNVSQLEYYIDNDPGTGSGHPVAISPGQDLANISVLVPVLSLASGNHSIFFRSLDANGNWSLINKLDFTYTSTLPLTLLDFTAYWNSRQEVTVEWQTSMEQNTRDFQVFRSADNLQWELVGTIPAAGSANGSRYYHLNDAAPLAGTSFYRVKMNDRDGNFKYSPIVRIVNKTAGFALVSISPVPVQGSEAKITLSSSAKENISWMVYDMQGRLSLQGILPVEKGMNTASMDFSRLTAGTYLLKVIDQSGETASLKFTRQ